MSKESLSSSLIRDLESLVSGPVTDDEAHLAEVSIDYGRTISKTPRVVVSPRTPSEVAAVVAYAYRQGLPISPRGSGFALAGQALNEGGVVLDMRGLDKVEPPTAGDDRCTVEVGAQWLAVVEATVSHGLVPPVLISFLSTTVGGTLAAAGFGTSSFLHGPQVEHVLELEVACHDGQLVWCSPESNRELFLHVLGGFGQFGVVTRAVLALRRCAPRTRTYFLLFLDLETHLAAQRRLMKERRVSYMEGMVRSCFYSYVKKESGGMRRLFSYQYPLFMTVEAEDESEIVDEEILADLGFDRWVYAEDLPMSEFLVIHTRNYRPETATTKLSYIYSDLLVPWDELPTLLRKTETHLLPQLINIEHIRLGILQRSAFTRPMVRVPDSELLVGLGIYTATPPRMAEHNLLRAQGFVDLGMKTGASYYLAGSLRFDEERYQQQFGDYWPEVLAAKKRFDPNGLFNPGFFPT